MKLLFATLLAATLSLSQTGAPSSGGATMRKEILSNDRLKAYLVTMAPGQVSPMHRHEHDMLSIFITPSELKVTDEKGSSGVKTSPGQVHFQAGPVSHSVANSGKSEFRVVDIEFQDAQGKREPVGQKRNHYCNPGSKEACVTEKYLFCTAKFCVEDVTMGPGAKSTQHSHDTEHMLVAISDYSLADDTAGKGVIQREVKSGGVEYLPAGITHVLTNTGKREARFIAIIFK